MIYIVRTGNMHGTYIGYLTLHILVQRRFNQTASDVSAVMSKHVPHKTMHGIYLATF